MVYNIISEKFIVYLIHRGIAKFERKDIYVYCMKKCVSWFGNILLLLMLGVVTNRLKDILVFIIFYGDSQLNR